MCIYGRTGKHDKVNSRFSQILFLKRLKTKSYSTTLFIAYTLPTTFRNKFLVFHLAFFPLCCLSPASNKCFFVYFHSKNSVPAFLCHNRFIFELGSTKTLLDNAKGLLWSWVWHGSRPECCYGCHALPIDVRPENFMLLQNVRSKAVPKCRKLC